MPNTSIPSLDQLRRDAKALKKAWAKGEEHARQRLMQRQPRAGLDALKHADFLHVIAQEQGFATWPQLVFAVETKGLDRAGREERLKIALYHGQHWVVDSLVYVAGLARGHFGLACALYDLETVRDWLKRDPAVATQMIGGRRPMLHLAFSKHIHARPDLQADMLEIARLLVENGADVNDSMPVSPEEDHPLSALYGAIGHAGNMALGQWLLYHGADPNDGESLYHATELGHHDGLRMLLKAGADPKGTNALLRAMDFHDVVAVRMLLDHGARADDFDDSEVGGEAPWTVPALHQAARRDCDREMADLLIDAGARPDRVYKGAHTYAYARVFGNHAVAEAIAARGAAVPLSRDEALLARAADGEESLGKTIDPAQLPPAYADIIRVILHLPGKLGHIKRLVALGMPNDTPDEFGLTPVHTAGWEGLPEMMAYFLSLKPDLTHVNGFGGTLLSTIIHGSENAPDQTGRDHLACLEMALGEGVPLPRTSLRFAGREDVAAFLQDWAEAHPDQVV